LQPSPQHCPVAQVRREKSQGTVQKPLIPVLPVGGERHLVITPVKVTAAPGQASAKALLESFGQSQQGNK
jgi:hypothetical protein